MDQTVQSHFMATVNKITILTFLTCYISAIVNKNEFLYS